MIKFLHYKKFVKTVFQNSLFLTETSPNSLASGLRSELQAEQKKRDPGNHGVRGWRSMWVILLWEVLSKTNTAATYLQAFAHASSSF